MLISIVAAFLLQNVAAGAHEPAPAVDPGRAVRGLGTALTSRHITVIDNRRSAIVGFHLVRRARSVGHCSLELATDYTPSEGAVSTGSLTLPLAEIVYLIPHRPEGVIEVFADEEGATAMVLDYRDDPAGFESVWSSLRSASTACGAPLRKLPTIRTVRPD